MFQARQYRRGWPEVVTAAGRRPFAERLAGVKAASWNGPTSAFESAPHAEGTRAVAQELVGSSACTGLNGGYTTAPVCTLSCPGSMSGGLPPAAMPASDTCTASPCLAWPCRTAARA